MEYWQKLRENIFFKNDLGVKLIKVQFLFNETVLEVIVGRDPISNTKNIKNHNFIFIEAPVFREGLDPQFTFPYLLGDIKVLLKAQIKDNARFGLFSESLKQEVSSFFSKVEQHFSQLTSHYPDFLPGYIDEDNEFSHHASFLFSKKRFSFLCGVAGSGKSTFVKSLLNFRFGTGLKVIKESLGLCLLKDNKKVALIVEELAKTSDKQQRQIMEKELEYDVVLVKTQYDFEALISAGVVTNLSLKERCLENKLNFYSHFGKTGTWRFFLDIWSATRPLEFSSLLSKVSLSPEEQTLSQLKSYLSSYSLLAKFFFNHESPDLRDAIEDFEVFAILFTAAQVGRTQHKIADNLGISRGSLQHKIRKYNLDYKSI